MSANRGMRLGHEETWERGFGALKKFKAREGHCQVPQSHLEGTFKLGQWVSVQRHFKNIIAVGPK
jgi:Helicase associated domain